MSNLELIWDQIEAAIAANNQVSLEAVVDSIASRQQSIGIDGAEECYAAGYACYMMNRGDLKQRAELWFMRALFYSPGHLGALLYLAYIFLDRGDIPEAARIVFSASLGPREDNEDLTDRLVEARVYCLAKMGHWSEALHHLEWFTIRMQEDANCGVAMINLMKLLDDPFPPAEAQTLLERVRHITTIR